MPDATQTNGIQAMTTSPPTEIETLLKRFDSAAGIATQEASRLIDLMRPCVNALAGYDPAKLAGLVTAVEKLMMNGCEYSVKSDVPNCYCGTCGPVSSALAAFQKAAGR